MEHCTDAGNPREFDVAADQDGIRLDRALEAYLPGSGLRLRRRLIESGRVHVGGRPAPASLKLRQGQRLTILPEGARTDAAGTDPCAAGTEGGPKTPRTHAGQGVFVVNATADYAALYKPAGLHSAILAGGGGASLEALLPGLFPGKNPRLLNRLDRLTTGLLLVALNTRAAKVFAAIAAKDVLKEYLAVVEGELAERLTLKRKLDTDDRKRTRVLGKLDPEARNWTLVFPQARLAGGRTLVRVRIQAGARHQIRAHLSAAGLPIVGDALYGDLPGGEHAQGGGADGMLFLHHARLEFSGFKARFEPPWLKGLEKLSDIAEDAGPDPD